ncbi:MAG: RNA polymerase sigma factor [Candidatus Doudnabacteria bacterium]|jgi:RNA polymerase sigma-70 factor (ECF subfamily)
MTLKEEQNLVRLAQSGDRDALSQLWDYFTPKLFGYLVNTLRDKTLAEDVFQSTWLKALEALPQYKFQGFSITAWIFTIARNECRQHWRKSSRETEFLNNSTELSGDDREQLDSRLLVEKILQDLSEDDRELLRLRYIADMSPEAIAEVLSINFVAVRVRLHRALSRARAVLTSQTI